MSIDSAILKFEKFLESKLTSNNGGSGGIDATSIGGGMVTNVIFDYLKNVSSDIQDQFNIIANNITNLNNITTKPYIANEIIAIGQRRIINNMMYISNANIPSTPSLPDLSMWDSVEITEEDYNKVINLANRLSSFKGKVTTFANLPSIDLTIGDIYSVENPSGTFLVNRKSSGLYIWDGANWAKTGDFDLILSELNKISKNNYTNTNPNVADGAAAGYRVGSQWYNISTNDLYICVNSTNGYAVWTNIGITNPTDIITNFDSTGNISFGYTLEANLTEQVNINASLNAEVQRNRLLALTSF